jgi:hypothetical protein
MAFHPGEILLQQVSIHVTVSIAAQARSLIARSLTSLKMTTRMLPAPPASEARQLKFLRQRYSQAS